MHVKSLFLAYMIPLCEVPLALYGLIEILAPEALLDTPRSRHHASRLLDSVIYDTVS